MATRTPAGAVHCQEMPKHAELLSRATKAARTAVPARRDARGELCNCAELGMLSTTSIPIGRFAVLADSELLQRVAGLECGNQPARLLTAS